MDTNTTRELRFAMQQKRSPYQSPHLCLLGDIRSLTEAGSAGRVEQDVNCMDDIGNPSRAMC